MADISDIRRSTNVGQEVEHRRPLKSTSAVTRNGPETIDAEEAPRTPLPKFQLFLILLIQFAEPITAVVIYPFVNQFVRDTGITQGDDRKTGYYAGVIESAFFFAEAVTVFHWGWLSDRFGRRPILLLGPLGLAFAMMRFGYSTSFWPMVWSRCMQGVFNGNIGVSKTVMVELSDSTNIGEAFAMMPLMWSAGTTIAPIMGGVLSNPTKRWPNVFGKISLFKEHPYFLPCLVSGILSFFTFVIGFLGLKETHPVLSASKTSVSDKERRRDTEISNASSIDTLLGGNDTLDYGTVTSTRCPSPASSEASTDSVKKLADPNSESATLRSVLASRKMQFIIINYIFLTFTDMCYTVLLPLIFSTSIETGGLSLTPYEIGLTMGIWGVINAFVQIYWFGKILRKYGGPSLYKVSYTCYLMCLLTFPLATYFAQQSGKAGFGAWVMILVQLLFRFFSYMTYGAIHVIIAESTPKRILGSMNGLVQMTGCMMRTLAPTFASSLFSVSIQEQILGGYFVYVVIYAIVLVGIGFSRGLADHKQKGRSA